MIPNRITSETVQCPFSNLTTYIGDSVGFNLLDAYRKSWLYRRKKNIGFKLKLYFSVRFCLYVNKECYVSETKEEHHIDVKIVVYVQVYLRYFFVDLHCVTCTRLCLYIHSWWVTLRHRQESSRRKNSIFEEVLPCQFGSIFSDFCLSRWRWTGSRLSVLLCV